MMGSYLEKEQTFTDIQQRIAGPTSRRACFAARRR